MTGHSTGGVVAVAATSAAALGGPLYQVFNEMALVMAITGGFGGFARGLALSLPIGVTVRSVLFGSLLSFGIGLLSPPLLARMFGVEIGPDTASVPVLASCGFVIGFLQDLVSDWLRSRAQKTKGGGDV